MKALLLIAALASMLAGCSMMPGRSSGSMPAESSSQTMGGKQCRCVFDPQGFQATILPLKRHTFRKRAGLPVWEGIAHGLSVLIQLTHSGSSLQFTERKISLVP